MPRGRPRKKVTEPFKLVDEQNNAPKCQNDTLENDNDTLEDKKGRKPSPKKYPVCTRCGKDIVNTNPFRVNLAYLTSVASYHRNVAEDVPTLCKECAKGLSDAVDKYLISGGAKKKFERE